MKVKNMNKKGFSLVEIITALVILSIASISLISHVLFTRQGAQATLDEMKGIAYAADMIDRIKTTPYSDIPLLNNSLDDETFNKLKITEEEMEKVKKPYERKVTITEVSENFNDDKAKFKMKKVIVEVNWSVSVNDGANVKTRPVSIKLTTLVRKLVNY